MTVADFFHYKTFPDIVADSYHFRRVLQIMKTVGNDFKSPGGIKFGRALLKLNYKNKLKENKETLLKEAQVFE